MARSVSVMSFVMWTATVGICTTGVMLAQPPGGGPPSGGRGGPPGGMRPGMGPGGGMQQGGMRQQRGGNTLMDVLDLDKDGSLSAAEIQAASESLLKLDRNKDGKLTADELGGGGQGGQQGMRGGMGPKGMGPKGMGPGGMGPAGRGKGQGGPPGAGPRQGPGEQQANVVGEGGPEPGPRPGGMFFPPHVRDDLNLSPEQQQKVEALERDAKAKLDAILNAEQKQTLDEAIRRGPPGGEGGPQRGRGPRGKKGDGEAPPE